MFFFTFSFSIKHVNNNNSHPNACTHFLLAWSFLIINALCIPDANNRAPSADGLLLILYVVGLFWILFIICILYCWIYVTRFRPTVAVAVKAIVFKLLYYYGHWAFFCILSPSPLDFFVSTGFLKLYIVFKHNRIDLDHPIAPSIGYNYIVIRFFCINSRY